MDQFNKSLDAVMRAGTFELAPAVREFVQVAASVIRDQQNRIAALEGEREGRAQDRRLWATTHDRLVALEKRLGRDDGEL